MTFVSSASGGTTQAASAERSLLNAIYPALIELAFILVCQLFGTWCGACVAPGQVDEEGFVGAGAPSGWRTYWIALSASASVK